MANNPNKTPSIAETNKTEGTLVHDAIAELDAIQCTMRQQSGVFITKKALADLEDRVLALMQSDQTSKSPTALIDMSNQLAIMTTRAEKAEATAKAATQKLAAIQGDLLATKTALEDQKRATSLEKAEIDKEKKRLIKDLQDAQASLKAASYGKTADPDIVKEKAAEVAAVQKELAERNAAYSASQAKVNSLHAKVKELEALAEHEKALKLRSEKAAFAKEIELKNLDPLPMDELSFDPELDSAILKKVYSAESLKLLKSAAEAKRSNIREYAFKLLEIANKQDPRNFVGYKETAHVLFQKVKSKTAKKRKAMLPVLDALFDSLVKKNGPKLKEVKADFKAFFAPSDDELDKERENIKSGDYSWWTGLKWDLRLNRIWLKIRYRQLRRKLSNFLAPIKPASTGWLTGLKEKFLNCFKFW